MNTLTLIEQITWAIVELTRPDGKPDLAKVGEVLNEALIAAFQAQYKEETLRKAVIRTAKVMGE